MGYRLHFVHRNQGTLADVISARLRSSLSELGYPDGLLQVHAGPFVSSPDSIECGLYLGSIEGKGDAECLQQIDGMHLSSVPVIPLFREGDTFRDVTPDALHPINAVVWKGPDSGEHVASIVLRVLGLSEKQRRVFVSYRRSDATRMGDQVWECLSQTGFEVFVDRFYVDPGVRFQDRLFEALSDKAFLLLIESPDVPSSEWVGYEIAYAIKNRLGILALTLPETVKSGRKVASVHDAFRFFLSDPDIEPTGASAQFSSTFLTRLPSLVEESHAKAMLRRRRQLMSGLEQELRRFSIPYTLLSDWSLVVLASRRGKKGDLIVSLTPRPPEIPDLFLLHGHCTTHKPIDRGILIHGHASIPDTRRHVFDWVLENRPLEIAEEDQIVQLVEQLAS